ncbi:rhamnosyltransferase WsaF family glycosyltransferase [Frondihabitans sp. Leaf304]|uniref:rhamnosyltransferase WsaF family glycosyltransferase n=1 Tax=Frondihabitans sp. Leaf304 TaxID=1736329 RepID=UPI0006F31185|nr:hypothetical protein [Frondihabitans sp. Leaf304]KQQ28058.1 hypothetical protein ASF54_04870 [Frondihabitans sp. Leaf304]
MNLTKIGRLVSDLARVNRSYLADSDYRNVARERLAPTSSPNRAVERREIAAAPPEARPFHGLSETSLALAGIHSTGNGHASNASSSGSSASTSPALNIVIGEVRDGATFAGIQTAVSFGVALAEALGLPVRVVMVGWTTPGNSSAAATEVLRERFPGKHITVVAREEISKADFSDSDLWLATHWKTAHAISVAVTAGRIDPQRVVYLVQDYEPGFSPWSTEFALARATYHAGFRVVVNSSPLQTYLRQEEGLEIPDDLVFAPHLDLDLLRRVAAERSHDDVVRVLFYGRPNKHRNLFRVGIAALRIAVRELEGSGITVEFASAGELHRDVELGGDAKLESVGTLPWDDYFRFIASRNVVLSLQLSPHPSHPPFDGAISGAHVVTNEFAGTRAGVHPGIDAVAADPEALGQAVARAIRRAAADGPAGFRDLEPGALGGTLDQVVARLATLLGGAR